MQELIPLQILYEDDFIIAINKPHDLLVHRSNIASDAKEFAVQLLRDQIGYHVFPIHRLDRKTAGVLLFAKEKKSLDFFSALFRNKEIVKTYHAIVRGYTNDFGTINYDLINEKGKAQDAITEYSTLKKYELSFSSGNHSTSRYSFIELKPATGRMHQIRKHMAHIFHPIIGDRPHGCNKQNKFWKENFDMVTMLLHASQLSFTHPVMNNYIQINAPFQEAFKASLELMESKVV